MALITIKDLPQSDDLDREARRHDQARKENRLIASRLEAFIRIPTANRQLYLDWLICPASCSCRAFVAGGN
jgi:hypothetical protein